MPARGDLEKNRTAPMLAAKRSADKAANFGFDTQRRKHEKCKKRGGWVGNQWSDKKDLCPSTFLKKKVSVTNSIHLKITDG